MRVRKDETSLYFSMAHKTQGNQGERTPRKTSMCLDSVVKRRCHYAQIYNA